MSEPFHEWLTSSGSPCGADYRDPLVSALQRHVRSDKKWPRNTWRLYALLRYCPRDLHTALKHAHRVWRHNRGNRLILNGDTRLWRNRPWNWRTR